MELSKDMLLADLIRQKPETIGTLFQFGLGCISCPASQMESIEEAAMVHGIDTEPLMEALDKVCNPEKYQEASEEK